MYRQSYSQADGGCPPIPTVIDAECGFDEGIPGRPRISMLSAQSSLIGRGYYNNENQSVPRQLRHPDRILAGNRAATGGNRTNTRNAVLPTASLVRTKSSVLVREQLRDLQGRMFISK